MSSFQIVHVDALSVLASMDDCSIDSEIGDTVFDGFCGGGSTGVSSLQHYRNVILCDIHEPAIFTATQKLSGLGYICELIRPRRQLQLVC
jgi:DNA modification methylase